ncbi:tyrosine-type recombinase/integrase [Corynebacterium antarcticum]|uniref:tyrosine-type recombinase/integrase n=1 Tax=Corynebacterium antarcticum TaxID=2800405 RepID=UPI002260817F|nr:site-specific integrase [Corynebacterium antarcticum]MCX7540614.1 tyrosine-type recombinase/integrase [Corynebacterium antarcticum]
MTQRRTVGATRIEDLWFKRDGTPSKRNRSWARWRVKWVDLDGRERSKQFDRKIDARNYEKELSAQFTRGEYVDPKLGRDTIGSIYSRWEPTQVRIKESTRTNRAMTWRVHVEPKWADTEVATITRAQIQAWVSEMVEAGTGAPTVENAFSLLRYVLAQAVDEGRIRTNPSDRIPLPRRNLSRNKYLTVNQVEELAKEVDYGGDFIRLLAYTGLRWGEMVALRVSSVDTTRRRINVDRAVSKAGGTLREDTPKTHQIRTVPYPDVLDDVMARAIEGKRSDDHLFTTATGCVLHNDTYRHRVYTPAVKALIERHNGDFPKVTIHDLRHTAASLAVSSGANVKAVQRMLGHAKASMTLDRYADLFDDDLDLVAVSMSKLIRGSGY